VPEAAVGKIADLSRKGYSMTIVARPRPGPPWLPASNRQFRENSRKVPEGSGLPARLGSRLVGALAAASAAMATGCYSYSYHLRTGVDLQTVAVENSPHSAVRWSSWWGAHEDEWSPVETIQANGKVRQVPYCDKGLGRVAVEYTAATFLMTVLTLGITVPMRVSAWCATDSGPHTGP
jgi:hypothetical protein